MPERDDRTTAISSGRTPLSAPSMTAPIPWGVHAIVLLGAFLMAAGALIAMANPAMLVRPGAEINEAVRIYAGYLTSRNLAIAVMLVAAVFLRARGMLANLTLLTAFVQIVDAVLDCMEGRWIVASGVVVLGLMFFAASARLSGSPFWKIGAWRSD